MTWTLRLDCRIIAYEQCVSKKGNAYGVILVLQGTNFKRLMVASGTDALFQSYVNSDVTLELQMRESYKYGTSLLAVAVVNN